MAASLKIVASASTLRVSGLRKGGNIAKAFKPAGTRARAAFAVEYNPDLSKDQLYNSQR